MLDEILAMPERDDLRLEFAATIREIDPSLANYIEVAVEAHRAGHGGSYRAPSTVLEARLTAPFQLYGKVGWEFHRGFVNKLYMHPEVFVESGDALLDLAPIIEVVLQVLRPARGQWDEFLPAVLHCPALARVRHLTLAGTLGFRYADLEHIIKSSHLDHLLALSIPWPDAARDPKQAAEEEVAMFEALFESPTFRRMIDWGLTYTAREGEQAIEVTRMRTDRQVGDRMRVEEFRPYQLRTSYDPMPPEDRALEQKYGYIPRLHAANWNATVLDVLRGKKPDFPAGSPVTEEMYAVPAPTEKKEGIDW